MRHITLKRISLSAFAGLVAWWSASGQVVYVGPDNIPIQETNYGYSSTYKVLRLGLDQSTRALALGIDPSAISGGNFTGNGQILIGNKGILAPNAAGSDWMAVLRATAGKVYVGGSLSSGEVSGDGLVVSSGNVGIGDTNPSGGIAPDPNRKLMVNGGITVGITQMVSYDKNYYVHAYSKFQGSSGEKGFLNYGYYGHEFSTRNGSALVIRGDTNNIGIGTTSPTHKLTVNGTIKAEEVIVEAGIAANDITIRPKAWADDVFAADYELPTTESIAAHVAENGHLPGVPSATEVGEKGVSVGEMQATLLRKVEELTLYIIEQDKRIRDLEQRLDAQTQ